MAFALSLAGAQDKLPVYVDGEVLWLPTGSAPSSHILKFDNRDFKHLPANELMILRLATAVGLPAVPGTLRRFGKATALLVERYDRVERSGALQRLHQEDLCQALGYPAERKYQTEGGPGLARCMEIVRRHSSDPLVDSLLLIRWQLFNAVVGNADGHAKNLALLHGATGTRLAPFYDLVCTRAYPRLDRRLAMHIGTSADPDALRRADWAAAAADLGVGERFLRDTAREMISAVRDALEPTRRSVEREFGRNDFLRSSVAPAIGAATRRLTMSLRG
ncbi:MAG: HipA domain-containing protein [Deltaproteobacteria bacterium]